MELQITNKKENKLLNRTEIEGTVTFDAAIPAKSEVSTKISATLGGDKNLVVLDHIYPQFGARQARIIAKVYKDKKSLDAYEPKPKAAAPKKEGAPAEKPAEAKAEAPKQEAPAEKSAEAKKDAPTAEAPKQETPAEKPPEKKTEAPKAEAPAEKKEAK
ncbi:MAG: hypothetical protein ABH829_02140 [archaeon]